MTLGGPLLTLGTHAGARSYGGQDPQKTPKLGGRTPLSKRFIRGLGLLLAGTFLAAACAQGGGAGGDKGEIIIATNFPTSGADRASGRGPEAGANYAVQTAATVKGFKLSVKNYDDAVNGVHDPQKGAQNFTDMVNNSKILGVVGPFNSNVARATIPVANKANLVMISPSNTNECLTQDFPYCDPKFRIAAPDTVQGPAMADFAIDTLKITKIAVWSDNETFGKGVADNFAKRFTSKGGTVVVRQDFDTKTTSDFKPFLQRAKDAGAAGIYAGATSATKGCIPRAQSKGIIDVPYMGPDGIGDSQCIKDAGDQATDKLYFTNAAAEGRLGRVHVPGLRLREDPHRRDRSRDRRRGRQHAYPQAGPSGGAGHQEPEVVHRHVQLRQERRPDLSDDGLLPVQALEVRLGLREAVRSRPVAFSN
ncbi:MAG: hypothetical protein E6J38_12320 [Chloroflexi bacterium]|nr:MAG: hypothetical protein E6J38_12320 [Chloroflexota bacterium]